MHDDRELVDACLSGSQDAWVRLYRRLYSKVHFVAFWSKWGFSREQSEEIMQDIYISLIGSLRTFDFKSSLETFAVRIAKNKCVSEIRRITAQKRDGKKHLVPLHEAAFVASDDAASPEQEAHASDTERLLASALGMMEEKCRSILRLKYYENYSYEDMCYVLSLPMGTVASRLKRCLLELRTIYIKYGDAQ